MIARSGFTAEAFISAIACTIGRDAHDRKDAEALTRAAIEAGDGAIYLAGGYWRAIPYWDDADQMIGVRLINPDRTHQEIIQVEQGIAVLCRLDYAEAP